jgi:hypothetical protein
MNSDENTLYHEVTVYTKVARRFGCILKASVKLRDFLRLCGESILFNGLSKSDKAGPVQKTIKSYSDRSDRTGSPIDALIV